MVAALLAQDSLSSSQQRWGIMEACRKISSVRAVSEARTRAIRETPRPSRWAEAIEQHSVPAPAISQPLFATETLAVDAVAIETSVVETVALETVALETAALETEREDSL
jgi:hypothetical protein